MGQPDAVSGISNFPVKVSTQPAEEEKQKGQSNRDGRGHDGSFLPPAIEMVVGKEKQECEQADESDHGWVRPVAAQARARASGQRVNLNPGKAVRAIEGAKGR